MVHEKFFSFFPTLLWIQPGFLNYLRWPRKWARPQREHVKYMVVLQPVKTWCNPKILQNYLIRYDPIHNSYLRDMEGSGMICSAVDILPTEFTREASQHFGDILSEFVEVLASSKYLEELPMHLRRACIVHGGSLTSLFEYIPRIRNSYLE